MTQKIARIISVVFHPVLLPTLGMILLLHSGFYFSMLSWEARRFIILVVFFTTAVLPMLFIAILALNPKFDFTLKNIKDRILPLMATAIFYYAGFMIMNKMRAFPVFKLFMLASALVIILMVIISLKWRISEHMVAAGIITGTLFALSFRSGVNPVIPVIIMVLVSGLIGTSRLLTEKNDLTAVFSGYLLGFTVLYFTMYFI